MNRDFCRQYYIYYTATNDRLTVNYELEIVWKEAAVAYLRHCPEMLSEERESTVVG